MSLSKEKNRTNGLSTKQIKTNASVPEAAIDILVSADYITNIQ